MTPDQINGCFELIGGLLLLLNCRRMYFDKKIQGISIFPCIFFTYWGYWNIFFYPSLDQWYSFYGGLVVAAINTLWLSMIWYYKGKNEPTI